MSRNQRRKKRTKPANSHKANRNANRSNTRRPSAEAVHPRSSTETKSSLKTTEFIAYVAVVLGVIITALAVDEDGQGGNDPFGAESAVRYIAYLTIGYLLARGLAKSGSHEDRIEHDTDGAARTGMVHDEDARNDDERVDDERVGDDDAVETAVVPSDRDQRPVADDVDVQR